MDDPQKQRPMSTVDSSKKSNITHLLIAAVIYLTLLSGMVLPFLPGDFDSFAMPLSLTIQIFSITGLITCVPAFLWLYHSLTNRNISSDTKSINTQKKIAKIYIYLMALAISPIILMILLTLSLSLGILLFFCLILSAKFFLKKIDYSTAPRPGSPMLPLSLLLLPILLLSFQFLAKKALTDKSRTLAMANGKLIIDEIENWKKQYGKYPQTLLAVHKDFSPGIIGIEKYHYSNDDSTYNLYFEQPKFLVDRFGTREFVVFNPGDQHLMLSHASWNTRWSPVQLRTNQGWYASGKTGLPHWKYFWFD
jgi:hypothetical protein